jgi:hypothetical protein
MIKEYNLVRDLRSLHARVCYNEVLLVLLTVVLYQFGFFHFYSVSIQLIFGKLFIFFNKQKVKEYLLQTIEE